MMTKQLLFAVFSLLSISLFGQQRLAVGQNYYEEGNSGIVYSDELSFDFKILSSRAFAIGVNIAKIKAYNHSQYFNIEVGNLRHNQEFRQNLDYQILPSNRVSRAFVYAKQNSAYVLRAAWGEKRYFSEKAKNKGVAVGASYAIGPNITFLKPYYLELKRFRDGQPALTEEKYSEDNAEWFLDLNRAQTIIGGAPFSKGLNELSVRPGVSAKAAVHFDWGAFDEYVKALEAGLMIDAYFKDLPIMIEHDAIPHMENTPVFLNLYLNLQFGKRK